MAFHQGSAYSDLLQNFHMISFFKNFPANFKSKIINGSYESINTYAVFLALRSESSMCQRSSLWCPAYLLESFSILKAKAVFPGNTDSLPGKDLEMMEWGFMGI